MICFSSLLPRKFSKEAVAILTALKKYDVSYRPLDRTKDI